MSKYTTELRFICETAAGLTESVGYASIDEVIEKAIPNIFSFDFPIFDDEYRDSLIKKGLENVNRFKKERIIEEYNKVYNSLL